MLIPVLVTGAFRCSSVRVSKALCLQTGVTGQGRLYQPVQSTGRMRRGHSRSPEGPVPGSLNQSSAGALSRARVWGWCLTAVCKARPESVLFQDNYCEKELGFRRVRKMQGEL